MDTEAEKPAVQLERVENWSLCDLLQAGELAQLEDEKGDLWRLQCLNYAGEVIVTRQRQIGPKERQGWKLVRPAVKQQAPHTDE